MKLVFMSQDMNYEDYLNNQKKKVTSHLTGIPFFTGCHWEVTIINNYSFECKYKYILNNIWIMKSILFILPLDC